MLVLSRKLQEAVVVDGTAGFKDLMKVTVLDDRRGCVKLGFEVAAEARADHCRGQYRSRTYSRGIVSGYSRCNNGTQQQVHYSNRRPVNYGCQVRQ